MSSGTAHQEKHFEAYIVAQLKHQGWVVGDTKNYDTERALYPDDIVSWLESTQPDKWDKLCKDNASDPRSALMDRIVQTLEKDGTVQALRRGIAIAGCGQIDLSEAAPEDRRNAEVVRRYAVNILRVVPQLKYHPSRELAIDLVFFINGIPVATVEVKTDFTQSAADAVEQYKTDRVPYDAKSKRKEPLLTFRRGAVVHFALSESEIWMATKLDGKNTFFLPFNRGRDGHAGNPPEENGSYPTTYFWDQVCQRDEWLRIFHGFVYTEKKDVVDLKGNHSKRETLIFPRFHQWDAVNAMVRDARDNGPGMQYLCEHSAGSGKTSTIAWTAHDLIKLRHDDGTAIFDSVIIVTDRTVLDKQLQDAVRQIDHQFGVIAAIDRQKSSKSKSRQLSDALAAGTPIVIVTVQTFPYAMEAIITDRKLADKKFAVIIDEAHASQTGENAVNLQAALSLSGTADKISRMDVEELLRHVQKSRVRSSNLSYFAFTATPKHSTKTLFGRQNAGGTLDSFHKYPMRQAIEEGFILDVLLGYTPYLAAFKLTPDDSGDDKRVSSRAARRALAQWMTLHPTNVTQKVEFIVRHFSRNVAILLGGTAKAMVVTSSRAAAVRYKKGFDSYIAKHPEHAGIRSLVAFSGTVASKDVRHDADMEHDNGVFVVDDSEEFTEANMNPDISGQDLRTAFERPEYRVMLVADKFQTGFDQPKLVAMYLDKKISNDVDIVQTLSRLNRTAPGKDLTFIIDFANEPEKVRKAFETYDSGAKLTEVQDLNVVYDIRRELDACGLYQDDDLDLFKRAYFAARLAVNQPHNPQHKALYKATERPAERYNQRLKTLRTSAKHWDDVYEKARANGNEAGMKAAEYQRKEASEQIAGLLDFRSKLKLFCRAYAYIAQLIDFDDTTLENFSAFAKLLGKRLDGMPMDRIDLDGLVLSGYGINARADDVEPDAESQSHTLKPLELGGERKPDEQRYMTEIIERINHMFGDATPSRDQVAFVNSVRSIVEENKVVVAQVMNNSLEDALKGNLVGAVEQGIVRTLSSYEKIAKRILKEEKHLMSALTEIIYMMIRDGFSKNV